MSNSFFPVDQNFVSSVSNFFPTTIHGQLSVQGRVDFFCTAIVDSSTRSFTVAAWESSEFNTRLTSWALQKEADISELKSVVAWQKHRIDYQAVYAAYLLGATTEEDYLRDSEQYVCELQRIDSERFFEVVKRLERLLDFKISIADLADYLKVDPASVASEISSGLERLEINPDTISKLISY